MIIVNCAILISQESNNYKYKKSRIYHSIIIQPIEYSLKGASDSIMVNFLFRIHHDELLFINENNTPKAKLNYSIALRNDENIIIKRYTYNDTLYSSNSNTVNNNLYYFKNINLLISNKNYKYEVEIDQKERSNLYNKKGIIEEFDGYRKNNGIGNLIYTYTYNDKLFASVLDSSFDFRTEGLSFYIPIYNPASKQYKFNITSIPPTKNIGFNINQQTNITDEASLIDEILSLNNLGNNEIQLIKNNDSPINYLKIDLKNYNLYPGNYILRIDNKSYKFSIEYLEQPSSLKNIDFAIKALNLILNSEEEKKLQDTEDKYKFIFNYFKPLDTSPKTLYNEAMNEYFRRVDYAYINYSDFNEKNGFLTPRGRIYILYGLPEDVELENNPNYSIERWIYSKINKEFEFEIKNGLYRLLK